MSTTTITRASDSALRLTVNTLHSPRLFETNPTLIDGQFELLLADHPEVFAYLRMTDSETLLVVGNLSTKRLTVPLPDNLPTGSAQVLIFSGTPRTGISQRLDLKPYDALLCR